MSRNLLRFRSDRNIVLLATLKNLVLETRWRETAMRVSALLTFGTNLFLSLSVAGAVPSPPWLSLLETGRSYYEKQNYAEALRVLGDADAEAYRQNAPELDRTNIWDSLGAAYEMANSFPAAQQMFDRALKARRRLFIGPDVNVAVSLSNESSLYWAMNEPKKAQDYAAASKTMWEQLGQTDRPEYAAALNNLSSAYRLEARLQEALPLMDLACKVYRRALPASSPRLLRAMENMAQEFKDLGEYERAEALHEEALKMARDAESTPRAILSVILNGFGDLRIAQSRLPEAESMLVEAIATESGASPASIQLAVEYNNLSTAYRLMGRVREAGEQAEKGLKALDGLRGQGDIQRGAILNNLGLIAKAKNNFQEAERFFHAAIITWRAALGDHHPKIAAVYSNLATLYVDRHQFNRAEKILNEVLKNDEAVLPRTHPTIARDLNNLGSMEFRRRHYPKAESYLREAVSIFRTTLGPEHPDCGLSEANLASALGAMKQADEAQRLYRESLKILERSWGPENPKLIVALESYAQFLRNNSQSALAEQTETRAMHIRVVNAIAAQDVRQTKS